MEMTEVAKVDGEEPWREVTLVAGTKERGLREDENEKESKAREEAGVDFGRANLRVTVCFSVQLALSHIEKYHFLLSPEQSVLFIPLSFWFSYKWNHPPVLSMNWLLPVYRKGSYYFCQTYSSTLGDSKSPVSIFSPIWIFSIFHLLGAIVTSLQPSFFSLSFSWPKPTLPWLHFLVLLFLPTIDSSLPPCLSKNPLCSHSCLPLPLNGNTFLAYPSH